MISGREIREARRLLGWDVSTVGAHAKVSFELIERAERIDGTPRMTIAQARKIRSVFEAAGVRFGLSGSALMAVEHASEPANAGQR